VHARHTTASCQEDEEGEGEALRALSEVLLTRLSAGGDVEDDSFPSLIQKHGAVHGGYAQDGYTLPSFLFFLKSLFHDVDRSLLVYHRVGI
jgi:hypothetical protein